MWKLRLFSHGDRVAWIMARYECSVGTRGATRSIALAGARALAFWCGVAGLRSNSVLPTRCVWMAAVLFQRRGLRGQVARPVLLRWPG